MCKISFALYVCVVIMWIPIFDSIRKGVLFLKYTRLIGCSLLMSSQVSYSRNKIPLCPLKIVMCEETPCFKIGFCQCTCLLAISRLVGLSWLNN